MDAKKVTPRASISVRVRVMMNNRPIRVRVRVRVEVMMNNRPDACEAGCVGLCGDVWGCVGMRGAVGDVASQPRLSRRSFKDKDANCDQ